MIQFSQDVICANPEETTLFVVPTTAVPHKDVSVTIEGHHKWKPFRIKGVNDTATFVNLDEFLCTLTAWPADICLALDSASGKTSGSDSSEVDPGRLDGLKSN